MQEEQREMLVECCPYLENVIPRSAAAAADPPPPLPPAPSTTSDRMTIDQDNGGGPGALAGSGVAAPDAESTEAEGVSVEGRSKNGGGDKSKSDTNDEQKSEEVGGTSGGCGAGGGSTITVLSQKSRRGERFLEPLGDVAAGVSTPLAHKKSKVVGGEAAVDRTDASDQIQGLAN